MSDFPERKLPPGVNPRSHLVGEVAIPDVPGFGVNLFVQSRASIVARLGPGALAYTFARWQLSLTLWRRTFTVLWQSEHSALD